MQRIVSRSFSVGFEVFVKVIFSSRLSVLYNKMYVKRESKKTCWRILTAREAEERAAQGLPRPGDCLDGTGLEDSYKRRRMITYFNLIFSGTGCGCGL